MADHFRTELVIEALQNGLRRAELCSSDSREVSLLATKAVEYFLRRTQKTLPCRQKQRHIPRHEQFPEGRSQESVRGAASCQAFSGAYTILERIPLLDDSQERAGEWSPDIESTGELLTLQVARRQLDTLTSKRKNERANDHAV